MKASITKEKALELAKGIIDLHSEADCEEQANCHGAAERLRNDAHADEKTLIAAGYDLHQLTREIEAARRARR